MADERRPCLVSVVGTRPEAIKMRPVLQALHARGTVDQQVILTGQHRGLARFFDFLAPGSIGRLAINLAEQSAGELRDAVHLALCSRLDRRRHDLVLVQGDTSSAYGGALAARDRGIPLGHVEAGLRSFDPLQPWPEECYRVAIDTLSDLLFAPSEAAAANLRREPVVHGAIHVTGNSGIDAVVAARGALPVPPRPRGGRKPILLTCHRRENRGEPLRRVAAACRRLVEELPVRITVPLHPSPPMRAAQSGLLGGVPHIRLVEPLRHEAMVAAMEASWLIVTDSGGLQEEAPALGRPLLLLRDLTERPEVVEAGSAALVGTDPDRIVAAVAALIAEPAVYARMAAPTFPYGHGDSGGRIAALIEDYLARPPAERRPERPLPCPADP